MGLQWKPSEEAALTEFMGRRGIKPGTLIKRYKNEFWEDAAAWVFSQVPWNFQGTNKRRTPDSCRHRWKQLCKKLVESKPADPGKNVQVPTTTLKPDPGDNGKKQQQLTFKNTIQHFFDNAHLAQFQQSVRLQARTVAAWAEIQGMMVLNKEQERQGQPTIYNDKAFFQVREKYNLADKREPKNF